MQRLILQLPWAELPPRYTCDGGDVSPPMSLQGLREDVQSLVVIVYHPHETGCCSFCAWILWNVAPAAQIPEGIPSEKEVNNPIQGIQGINDYGRIGYSGPCPRPGSSHRVNYKIYGLDTSLDLPGGSSQHALIPAMKGHVLQFGETFAMYSR
jgi:conserved hypothetical protein TIGR00481